MVALGRAHRHRRRQVYAERGEGGLELTAIGEVAIERRLGEGVSSVVYLGRWRAREVVLKLHKAGAVERHARLHPLELAEFEYRRNLAFYEAPGLQRHVARPLAYLSTAGVSAMVQERVDGVLYYHYYRARQGSVSPRLGEQLRRIVELAHAAGLYDVDLHAGNVLVAEEAGEPVPKLFDFNFIPFYEHPPNPLVAVLLRLGWLDLRSRDRRKLRDFHDFRRVERLLRRHAG